MFDIDLGGNIDITLVDNRLYIKGLYAKTVLNDLARVYKFNNDEGALFFSFVMSGFIFQRITISFHRFFSLEVYHMFDRLYMLTKRYSYESILDQLPKIDDNLKAYLDPPLSLPEEFSNKMLELKNLKLFPYQKEFLTSFYNGKFKLGLDGYILAFEQGLGKTYTAITTVHCFDLTPTIITAPKSTLESWRNSILKIVPNVKSEEVQFITEVGKNKTKWKYLICNYERLGYVQEATTFSDGQVKSLLIDECHNFRYMTTGRTKNIITLKEQLGIKNIIPISGTPIKALASELIPMMKMIDPMFDQQAEHIFKKMYSRDRYSRLCSEVLKTRLNLYIERRLQSEAMELAPPQKYLIKVKISNITPYLIETVKKDIREYLDNELPKYAKEQTPNFLKLKNLVDVLSGFSKEEKEHYIELVKIKINNPMRDDIVSISEEIRLMEKSFTAYDSQIGKQIVHYRKFTTSYMQVLLGKAMGIYFIQNKIKMINQMTSEAVDDIVKIIKTAEKKVVIFSTFLEPLNIMKKLLDSKRIGSIVITGGMDTTKLLKEYYTNNMIEVLLATSGSIGTGTDGLQKSSDLMIFLNQPYRSTDTDQCIARIYRRGQDTPVKVYFLKIDTDEPNILDHEREINEWSRKMFKAALS